MFDKLNIAHDSILHNNNTHYHIPCKLQNETIEPNKKSGETSIKKYV